MLRQRLDGSDRAPAAGARAAAVWPADDSIEISVILRRPRGEWLSDALDRLASGQRNYPPMTRERFTELHGASLRDIDAVTDFARAQGLSIMQVDRARRTMKLAGPVGGANAAFGIELRQFDHPGGRYRSHIGGVLLPTTVIDSIEAVLGLDDRRHARPHFRLRPPREQARPSYTPVEVAALYGFPEGDGGGESVAIVELGGGYHLIDLAHYFAKQRLPMPTVIPVSVDHAVNRATGDPSGPDGEVVLDIEIIGSLAPKSRLGVYFAPNTEAGFVDAVTTAIHDRQLRPSVLSISWGAAEESWSGQALRALDAAFQDAAVLGVSVVVASGDGGPSDGLADGKEHVDFPASSPHVLACGGTTLVARHGAIASETVWNDRATHGAGGGGISHVFPVPQWQRGLSVLRDGQRLALAMRGVPDVAADADPLTGYDVRVDGYDAVIGGTSAVAPLWAGLVARINGGAATKLGYLNPLLYAHREVFHDIARGDNGDFDAAVGWDACTGLGSPIGRRVADTATRRADPKPAVRRDRSRSPADGRPAPR
jgi:kumamolisin